MRVRAGLGSTARICQWTELTFHGITADAPSSSGYESTCAQVQAMAELLPLTLSYPALLESPEGPELSAQLHAALTLKQETIQLF